MSASSCNLPKPPLLRLRPTLKVENHWLKSKYGWKYVRLTWAMKLDRRQTQLFGDVCVLQRSRLIQCFALHPLSRQWARCNRRSTAKCLKLRIDNLSVIVNSNLQLHHITASWNEKFIRLSTDLCYSYLARRPVRCQRSCLSYPKIQHFWDFRNAQAPKISQDWAKYFEENSKILHSHDKKQPERSGFVSMQTVSMPHGEPWCCCGCSLLVTLDLVINSILRCSDDQNKPITEP